MPPMSDSGAGTPSPLRDAEPLHRAAAILSSRLAWFAILSSSCTWSAILSSSCAWSAILSSSWWPYREDVLKIGDLGLGKPSHSRDLEGKLAVGPATCAQDRQRQRCTVTNYSRSSDKT